ncbi:MAG: L-threonylcarbamoyladenylate synthase [Planctomycetota bacterium]|jgi:L-threonylcarbamoyladenylate synthase|nr:L-threonylcarbamoyladenylate synthase [Planctomycetota bacterium]
MKTTYFSALELVAAAELIKHGELAAFPTETVYGLGADALNAIAVQKIFEAKGRPADNPLIVHVADVSQLALVARSIPVIAEKLMARFWPGPLTVVLPKRQEVSSFVTAGLDTVAVRFPSHPIAIELIRLAGTPLAAPSANRSGSPSATTWQAVADDLDGRIAGIIKGEPTSFGLESTVVDATCDPPRVLRPGGVTFEELKEVCDAIQPFSSGLFDQHTEGVNSPGLKYKHYQPRAKVVVFAAGSLESELQRAFDRLNQVHYIGVNLPANPLRFGSVMACCDVDEYATKLFDTFRKADTAGAKWVYCEAVAEVGIGVALMDRLRRASQ